MKLGHELVENDIVWSCAIDWGEKEPVTLTALRESAQPGVVICEYHNNKIVGLAVTGNGCTKTKNAHGGWDHSVWCFPVDDGVEFAETCEEAMELSLGVEERYGKRIQDETSGVRAEMKALDTPPDPG